MGKLKDATLTALEIQNAEDDAANEWVDQYLDVRKYLKDRKEDDEKERKYYEDMEGN